MSQSWHSITLESALDISKAHPLCESLQEAYEQHDMLSLNGQEVERITTPAIQILLSFFNTVEKSGKSCQVVNPSDAMKAAFADLGLSNALQSRVS